MDVDTDCKKSTDSIDDIETSNDPDFIRKWAKFWRRQSRTWYEEHLKSLNREHDATIALEQVSEQSEANRVDLANLLQKYESLLKEKCQLEEENTKLKEDNAQEIGILQSKINDLCNINHNYTNEWLNTQKKYQLSVSYLVYIRNSLQNGQDSQKQQSKTLSYGDAVETVEEYFDQWIEECAKLPQNK